MGEAGVPAGQGGVLRRRHPDRRSAARRSTGPGDRQARHHLGLQRQGQRAEEDPRGAGQTTAAGCSWSATRPATSKSCTTSRRACWSTCAKKFTKDCHELGIKIHGTFILGLPGETKETIQETIRFAKEINPHTIQVSLAAPYPGTFLYKQAKENGWFDTNNAELVDDNGIQIAPLHYPHLSHSEIFNSVEEFYKKFYFRAPKIAAIVNEMVRSPQMMKRRLREGVEFFQFLRERRAAAL